MKVCFHQELNGALPTEPRSVNCDRAIRYSGFFRVRETWVRPLEISWTLLSNYGFLIIRFPYEWHYTPVN